MKIRCSVICLSAELHICKFLCDATGGSFHVALSTSHLQELVQAQVYPPAELSSVLESSNARHATDLVYMGFPKRHFDRCPTFAYSGRDTTESSRSFMCPRCKSRATSIPTCCCVCGLQLNSSTHIARSYHHLFPVPDFQEYVPVIREKTEAVKTEGGDLKVKIGKGRTLVLGGGMRAGGAELGSDGRAILESAKAKGSCCFGCHKQLHGTPVASAGAGGREQGCDVTAGTVQCPACKRVFCSDCDAFIHDSLHNCPGCT